jgi:hypothetical protein
MKKKKKESQRRNINACNLPYTCERERMQRNMAMHERIMKLKYLMERQYDLEG